MFFAPITIAMRPVNASVERSYTAWPLAEPRSRQTMSYSSFEPWATRLVAEHFANGLFALTTGTGISSGPRVLDRQMIVVLSTPHLSRCGNSSRAVNSYEPLGGESGFARKSWGCANIGKRTVAKSARVNVLPLIWVPCVGKRLNWFSLHNVRDAVGPFSAFEPANDEGDPRRLGRVRGRMHRFSARRRRPPAGQARRYYMHEKTLNSLIGTRSYQRVQRILSRATQELTVLDTLPDWPQPRNLA